MNAEVVLANAERRTCDATANILTEIDIQMRHMSRR